MREMRSVQMAFREPSHRSFFSSRVSPFSPGDRYFHKMSKRIGQVSRQVFCGIKDEQNRRYCKKCIVIGSQSHEIVQKIVHKHVKMRETISIQPALSRLYTYRFSCFSMFVHYFVNYFVRYCEPITVHFSQYHRFRSSLILRES